MKKVFNFLSAVSLVIVFALFYGCKKEEVPTLTTTAVSSITTISASSGGNITDDGGADVTARGVCWGTATMPAITGSKTTDGTGIGSFTSSLTGLTPNTKYYVRAYATNSEGTGYGSEVSFSTNPIVFATISTVKPTTITATTANPGGNITADGGAPITERGVVWALTANPTTDDHKVAASAAGTGAFTVALTQLQPGTLYHIKAYAINTAGTVYGADEFFSTSATKPSVTTAAVTVFTQTTATAGGEVTATGGAEVTERGVYYGTQTDPVTTGTKVSASAGGSGVFTCSLTSLTAATTYHVKAYAANSAGTEYGSEVTFTTSAVTLAVLTTTAPVLIPTSTTSVTAGGNVTSAGGGTITERGVCWSTSATPVYTGSHIAATTGGTGSFVVTMTNLLEGTLYYVRAYALNAAGPAYGNEVQILTMMSDLDNNIYKTVKIGTQIWMAENLKTTKYKDGITGIPYVTDPDIWKNLTGPAYCWYNNEATYKPLYGAMYNWFTVSTGNLCPNGWRVPTDAEWTTLTTLLGGESVAGGKLKETGTTHWTTPNTGATNDYGFTALPGGYRYWFDGSFANIGLLSYWWSSTVYEFDTEKGYYRELFNDQASVFREGADKKAGKYVRCVK
jgi:uncharacterized protein (TIGR02145 family)